MAQYREVIGLKYDEGKPKWDLLPWREVGQIVDVITHGAEKYGICNWQHLKPFRPRYFGALFRHTIARLMGEKIDRDSGLPHLAHAGCNILFLLWADNEGLSEEDLAKILGREVGK